MVWQFKLPLLMWHIHIRGPVRVLAPLLVIQLPANVPVGQWMTARSTWVPATHMADPDGVPDCWRALEIEPAGLFPSISVTVSFLGGS